MSATWNILTFTVPGKQHILHCVPSAPLRFSKGAKTTTQLGRLHPSLWRTDPVLICRVSLLSFNSCSQNQSPKQKTPAQWHTNLQPWRTKIPAISCGTRIICEVCPPASLRPQCEDHRLLLWRQYWSGLTEHIRLWSCWLLGVVVVVVVCRKVIRHFEHPQPPQADSRCQRLTESIGPKWVCWFNMMSVT